MHLTLILILLQRIYHGIDVLVELIGGIGLKHVAGGHISCVGISYLVLVHVEPRKLCICTDLHVCGLEHEFPMMVFRFLLFVCIVLRDRR